MTDVRHRVAAAVAVAIVVVSLAAPGPSAEAVSSDGERYLANINALRTSLGMGALQLDAELTALAQNWAEQMAADQALSHPPDIRAGVTSPWIKLGDNTARGSTFDIAWDELVTSPVHYRNLTDPEFTHIGIGVAHAVDGVQYTHEWFMTIGPTVEVPPETEPTTPPPTAPLVEPAIERPTQVLGTVEFAEVNVAVIPPISYGRASLPLDPSDGSSSPLPTWLLVALAALLLAIAAALAMRSQRRRRAA